MKLSSIDQFAKLLAEGATPAGAAIKLGKRPEYGRVLLQRIVARLGSQAR